MSLADLVAGKDPEPAEESAEPALGLGEPEGAVKAAPAKEEDELETAEPDERGEARVPVKVVGKERARRREAEERAAKYEKELKSAGEVRGAFDRVYGKFEKPLEQMQQDADFAQAVYELKDDPDIQKALAKINQHYHGAKRVTERTEKPAEPQTDPRVEALFQERLKDRAVEVLRDAKVKKELHGVLTDYVLKQNPNPTREAVLSTLNEYVVANGWTKEFIREAPPSKQRATPLPNPGALNAGTPREKTAPANPDKPKNLSGLQAKMASEFRQKLRDRLPA
jgi:hypothetical protein